MSIFDIFKTKKNIVCKDVQDVSSPDDNEIQKSMQCVGMDFLLNTNFAYITNKKEQWFEEEFACISAVVFGRPSLIFSMTTMYPNSYDEKVEKIKEDFLETANEFNSKGDLDLYLVGVGLINKDDMRKGVFKVGNKYSVCLGTFILLRPANDLCNGLITDSAVQLSSIDEEYCFINALKFKYGKIFSAERNGSIYSDISDSIIDKWTITTITEDIVRLQFKYPFFVDAYSNTKNIDLGQLAFFSF
jgi:hypothetical protein